MPQINAIDGWVFKGTPATTTDPVIDLGTNGNRIDLDTDNDTSIRASADDIITLEVGGTDELALNATALELTTANFRSGPVVVFATTEPTQAVVLEAGTAPAGAIVTSNAMFSSATVLRKIIAAGTVSDIET